MPKEPLRRKDALRQVPADIGWQSIILKKSTPVPCLACRRLNDRDFGCKVGQDQEAVQDKWMWKSGPNTPLTDICPKFEPR